MRTVDPSQAGLRTVMVPPTLKLSRLRASVAAARFVCRELVFAGGRPGDRMGGRDRGEEDRPWYEA